MKLVEQEVGYINEKTTPVKIDRYTGSIIEGTVNDSNEGIVAANGQTEIKVIFPNIKGKRFGMFMKIDKELNVDIFKKIISTLKFSN